MKEILIKLAEILPALQKELGTATLRVFPELVEVNFKTSAVLHSIPKVPNSEVSIFADDSRMLNIRYTFLIDE